VKSARPMCVLFLFAAVNSAAGGRAFPARPLSPPVSYHLSFDAMDFLEDDTAERRVAARLCRLKKGIYRVTLSCEGKDRDRGAVLERTEELTRFSTVIVPVRPGRELVLKVELVKRLPAPGPLPDPAISGAGGSGGKLLVLVNNFGASPAENVAVRIEDHAGKTVSEEVIGYIKCAKDFVPGEAAVVFPVDCDSPDIRRIVVDPGDGMEEIFEGNNVWEKK